MKSGSSNRSSIYGEPEAQPSVPPLGGKRGTGSNRKGVRSEGWRPSSRKGVTCCKQAGSGSSDRFCPPLQGEMVNRTVTGNRYSVISNRCSGLQTTSRDQNKVSGHPSLQFNCVAPQALKPG